MISVIPILARVAIDANHRLIINRQKMLVGRCGEWHESLLTPTELPHDWTLAWLTQSEDIFRFTKFK